MLAVLPLLAAEPTWRKRGCGTSLLAVLAVSCGLWAAVLVPLILWGPL